MADALGQPLVEAESLHTRTPPNPCAGTLTLTQEHDKELWQWWQNQPPPALARSAQYPTPRACNPSSGTQGHTRQVQRHIMDGGNDPPQLFWAGQNIAAAAMLLRGLAEPVDPQEQAVHQNLRALVETTAVQ